ncbi:hypothetical protein [Psychrobacter sp. I-STPA10]|uniref:hypothetical protein n=1 Tax=Psychrobacter sp. I-STPA10 TaxID=2585769 RepID=UPI001E28875C|nr:hypothetical protein [Psychrobacter sp. I-STPA10]
MRQALIALLIMLGIGISPYSMAASDTQSNEEAFVDVIGSICEREAFDIMIIKQSGGTPDVAQQYLNNEILQPLQKTIQEDAKVNPDFGQLIIDLSAVFSQIILRMAWEDNTNVVQEQVTKYGSAELNQKQQEETWEQIKTHAAGFSTQMEMMCETELHKAIPTLQKK